MEEYEEGDHAEEEEGDEDDIIVEGGEASNPATGMMAAGAAHGLSSGSGGALA